MLGVQGTLMWALVQSWFTPTGLFVLVNLVIGTIVITSMGSRSHQGEEHRYEPPELARAPSFLERLRSIGSFRYRYLSDDIPPEFSSPAPPASGPEGFNEPSKLARTPSVLERLRSIGSFRYHSNEIAPEFTSPPPSAPGPEGFDETPKLARTPSLLERLGSIGLYRYRSREIPPESSSPPPPAPSFEEFDESHAQGQHNYERSQSEPWAKEKPAARTRTSTSANSAPGSSEEEEDVLRRPSMARADLTEKDEDVDARAEDFITRFRHQLKLQRLDSIIRYTEMLNRGK